MFKDKNGKELKVGDYIIPDEGMELLLTEEKYMDMVGCDCLIGTQVANPQFFSILTQDNLSKQWKLVENESEHQEISSSSIIIQPLSVSENDNDGGEVCPEPSIIEVEPPDDKEWEEREKISAK